MKDVFYGILRTIAVSVILFVISWSLVTHEFPPKVDKMMKGVARMKEMMALTQEIASVKLKKDQDQAGAVTDDKMKALENKWAKLTTEILPTPDKPADTHKEELEIRVQRLEEHLKLMQQQIDLMHAGI